MSRRRSGSELRACTSTAPRVAPSVQTQRASVTSGRDEWTNKMGRMPMRPRTSLGSVVTSQTVSGDRDVPTSLSQSPLMCLSLAECVFFVCLLPLEFMFWERKQLPPRPPQHLELAVDTADVRPALSPLQGLAEVQEAFDG